MPPRAKFAATFVASALSLAPLAPAPAAAQRGGHHAPAPPPPTWGVVADRQVAADSGTSFVTMPPGWHLTAGPAAGSAFFDTTNVVAGASFRVESQLFLFSSTPGVGAGVLFGGKRGGDVGRDYAAFVVGPDGRFRVTRREGESVRELVPWTANPAVAPHPGGRANVKQTLAVAAAGDSVRFEANGVVLATLPRAAVRPEGVVGLRADPGANVHVATLLLDGRNVAPAPPAGAKRP